MKWEDITLVFLSGSRSIIISTCDGLIQYGVVDRFQCAVDYL